MVTKRNKYTVRFLKGKGRHKFRWHIVASNGRVVCSAEGFLHRHGPKKTVANLIKAIKNGEFKQVDDEDYNKR